MCKANHYKRAIKVVFFAVILKYLFSNQCMSIKGVYKISAINYYLSNQRVLMKKRDSISNNCSIMKYNYQDKTN